MTTYLLFGVTGNDIRESCDAVGGASGIQMMPHESDYRGGEYFRFGDTGVEHFILQRNFQDDEGEWVEPAFQKYHILLYVNETVRGAEIASALG